MHLRKLGRQLIATGCLYFAMPVYGHAVLLSATPGANAVVHGASIPVQLRFNSRIDRKRSMLRLIDPQKAQHVLTIGTETSPDVLMSTLDAVAKGSYILQWQVLAVDGHITRGEVRFRVE
ncbi:MAG: copper resistance CopC family protein [Bryobacteraceae bacterium]